MNIRRYRQWHLCLARFRVNIVQTTTNRNWNNSKHNTFQYNKYNSSLKDIFSRFSGSFRPNVSCAEIRNHVWNWSSNYMIFRTLSLTYLGFVVEFAFVALDQTVRIRSTERNERKSVDILRANILQVSKKFGHQVFAYTNVIGSPCSWFFVAPEIDE